MDHNAQQQPERLEDQLRRMMLSNGRPQADPLNQQDYSRPVVRLPPQQWSHGTPFHADDYTSQGQCKHAQSMYSVPRAHQHNLPQASHRQLDPTHIPAKQASGGRTDVMDHARNAKHTHQMPPPPYPQRHFHPNTFNRGQLQHHQPSRQLFDYHGPTTSPTRFASQPNWREMQAAYLEQIASKEVSATEMTSAEHGEKDAFRAKLQDICSELSSLFPKQVPQVSLECFGSLKSGFASAGSDMDLVIVADSVEHAAAGFSLHENDLPRLLEKQLLQNGIGARLLTRTRVPIIKVCEKPDNCLLDKLRAEREKWDMLPNETKYPHLHADDEVDNEEGSQAAGPKESDVNQGIDDLRVDLAEDDLTTTTIHCKKDSNLDGKPTKQESPTKQTANAGLDVDKDGRRRAQQEKKWTRERKAGPLDFPKEGIGIQCDINFFNPLGLHNTQMLRCYSLCDQRVRPIVLFVKAWAKQRKINSSYSGTLSSYGYVMMVLHYLVNIARPPVLPNLQIWHPFMGDYNPEQNAVEVDGWTVSFFKDEQAIMQAAQSGRITSNRQSVGALLAEFFHYYSSLGGGQNFHWMQSVLSLRTQGGLLSKEQKGWVKATTEEGEGKKVQHRYLFCIEDPFELQHNIARTVTHFGIVAIRDEFRRAHRVLIDAGNGRALRDGEMFDGVVEPNEDDQDDWNLRRTVGSASDVQPLQSDGFHRSGKGRSSTTTSSKPRTTNLDVMDQEAFPALGGGGKSKKGKQSRFSEISGPQAKAHLEEVRRKKAEEMARDTATSAAESVLKGFE